MVHGGSVANVDYSPVGAILTFEHYVGGIYAIGGQKLALGEVGLYVCSRKTDGAPKFAAVNHAAFNREVVAEQSLCSSEIGLRHSLDRKSVV